MRSPARGRWRKAPNQRVLHFSPNSRVRFLQKVNRGNSLAPLFLFLFCSKEPNFAAALSFGSRLDRSGKHVNAC